MSELRQRKADNGASVKTTTTKVEVEDKSSVISLLDVFRILFLIIGVTCASSYYVTSGESLIFKQPRPWFTKPNELARYFQGGTNLTPEQLLKYNGKNPDLPIYLAINGTIFDVSAGARMYGPGGSYAAFSGHDASRAYVTGCFKEDLTGDLRGAEEAYMPIDDPDEDISPADRKIRAERERRLAKEKVQAEVNKWYMFYKNSNKYFEVGKVITKGGYSGPAPTLCPYAEKGRPKRKAPVKNEAPGKPVQ